MQDARPVDAVTAYRSGSERYLCFNWAMIAFIRTDLPVPAEPVKKTLLPSSITAFITAFCSSLKKVSGTRSLGFGVSRLVCAGARSPFRSEELRGKEPGIRCRAKEDFSN